MQLTPPPLGGNVVHANFVFIRPFVFELGARTAHRRTDGQTDKTRNVTCWC